MLEVGQKEINAVAKVIRSGRLFRHHEGSQCARFEQRYGEYLGTKHVHMCSSGTQALTAGLVGLGIGPGDEVIVPAHTYMATAIAVLSAGAIPVIVDIDESIALDPDALDDAIGPCTRAVIPVHMWGTVCDMRSIMRIARKRKLLVLEDACQCVGGGYEGRKVGTIGHAGAFSFNYFKNMTCGEGGAVVTKSGQASQRIRCAVDCCGFFWTGRRADEQPFAFNGARASEIEGALMNMQLDRIDGLLRRTRSQKKRVLKAVAKMADIVAPAHSLDHECGLTNIFNLPDAKSALKFAKQVGGGIAGQTGRHTFNEWDQILARRGSHHSALNPYTLPQNRKCRRTYPKTMCRTSLDILGRTVMVSNDPKRKADEVKALIARIESAAAAALKRPAK